MNAAVQDMRERLRRWPLVTQLSNRSESPSTDARLINCHAERDPNTDEYVVQKRVGYTLDYAPALPGDLGLGVYAFGTAPFNVAAYSIFSHHAISTTSTMYKDGLAFGTVGGLDGTTTAHSYHFVEDQGGHLVFTSNLNVYFFLAGAGGWTVAANPLTGGATIIGLAFLDQTIYLFDSQGNIFGSAFNDPSTWLATNKVIANAIAGFPTGFASQLNYILAFKSNSMEVFYDAGNPPPGSPLSPVAGALSNYGALLGSVRSIDDVILYVTGNKTVSPQVARVDNLQVTIVSTPAVDRLLDKCNSFYSWTFKHGGHRFYGIAPQNLNAPFTAVYDIDQKLWYQWTAATGGQWPLISMAYDINGNHLAQGLSDGSVYLFEGDYQYPTDNGVVVPVDIYTPNMDFGTRRRKTMHRMYFNADQTPGSLLYVSRSDNDYKNFSRPRKVDLSRETPYLDGEGTFTRRAYHFQHKAPTAFRIRSSDLQMELGTI